LRKTYGFGQNNPHQTAQFGGASVQFALVLDHSLASQEQHSSG